MPKLRLLPIFWLFVLTCLPLRAQSGCVDSPENPTAILALVGVAGVLYVFARKE